MKSKLVPYEVIKKAVDGDTASLLAIQQHYKLFIGYLSNGDDEKPLDSIRSTVMGNLSVGEMLSCFLYSKQYDLL